jgi:RNA polymerase sigma-70 factor (ECF subfamily)
MELPDADPHLSEIDTIWETLAEAQQQGSAGVQARNDMLLRYYGAVRHYLISMLHDTAEADELLQEFAVRFLRGDFGKADPGRGRFRDLLKTAVRHLVIDHWRRRRKETAKRPQPLAEGAINAEAALREPAREDPVFVDAWRRTLLARTWEALLQSQKETGQPYYTLLYLKAGQPALRSAQLAERLSAQLGKSFTEASVRQTLHRARQRFAELLVAEVAGSLPTSDAEALTQELIELRLLDYCRPALGRRKLRS